MLLCVLVEKLGTFSFITLGIELKLWGTLGIELIKNDPALVVLQNHYQMQQPEIATRSCGVSTLMRV